MVVVLLVLTPAACWRTFRLPHRMLEVIWAFWKHCYHCCGHTQLQLEVEAERWMPCSQTLLLRNSSFVDRVHVFTVYEKAIKWSWSWAMGGISIEQRKGQQMQIGVTREFTWRIER